MDRVFLDANVLFSAAYRGPSGLGALWTLSDVRLVTSPYVLAEAARNLERPDQIDRLTTLMSAVQLVEDASPPDSWPDLPPKDLPVVGAAVAASATHLLTGDKRHFGRYFGQRLCGVLILRPGDYIAAKSRAV